VIANAKHFIDNNQETNRGSVSANVDERTEHEMYLPPFEGAVTAGVLSVMCSYNRVNDVYSCENPTTLTGDLKDTLSFPGWVVRLLFPLHVLFLRNR
jgi:beta-glucosidase